MSVTQTVSIPNVKLASGLQMPVLGFGTSRTGGQTADLYGALNYAFQVGYRHIDGAFIYFTDDVIYRVTSECFAKGHLKREDIFVTCKLWNTFHTREMAKVGLMTSLKNLSTDYLDMLLIHWPMGFKDKSGSNPYPLDDDGNLIFDDTDYLETYHAMEEFVKNGQVKSIGLSNFNISQVERVLKNCKVKPDLIQIECNPYLQNDKLIDFCQNNGINVCAYGVLGAYDLALTKGNIPMVLEDETLIRIGNKYNKTAAQVCIRWCLQRNLSVLTGSLLPDKILENAQVFDFNLSQEDMQEIKKLNKNLRLYKAPDQKHHQFYPFNEE